MRRRDNDNKENKTVASIKTDKTRYFESLHSFVSLNFKNDKSPIEHMRTNVQEKWCFFMV